jgi:hypothetical protein
MGVGHEAFAFEDPTASLPEDVLIYADAAGVQIQNKEGNQILSRWDWAEINAWKEESAVDPEEMDLFHLTPSRNFTAHCFECEVSEDIVSSFNQRSGRDGSEAGNAAGVNTTEITDHNETTGGETADGETTDGETTGAETTDGDTTEGDGVDEEGWGGDASPNQNVAQSCRPAAPAQHQ